jgi:ribonuclease BN (tRNA processing enzyme)
MTHVTIQIIGCGDAFGSGGQVNTCFFIHSEPVTMLLDCGASSLPALKKHGINIRDIDLIAITHFHGDHYGGLPFLLLELAIFGQVKPLKIITPPGCRDRLASLLDLLYPGSGVLEKVQVEFIEYQSYQLIETNLISLKAFPVIHSTATLPHGLRITIGDIVISYSGDTEWTDVLADLSADADLFICECNYFEKKVKGHLNYRQLEEKLPLLKPRKFLLTHFDTEMLTNLHHLHLPYAKEGQSIELR